MHNIIIVVRDPDASNDYKVFGPNDTQIVDVDLGYADLSDADEFDEWAESHEATASELDSAAWVAGDNKSDAAVYLREIVEGVRERYNHPKRSRRD